MVIIAIKTCKQTTLLHVTRLVTVLQRISEASKVTISAIKCPKIFWNQIFVPIVVFFEIY